MQVFDMDQGSEAWHLARAGVPTASMFSVILARGKGGAESKTRRTYLLRLAAERISGIPAETFSNGHMERGRLLEGEARSVYCFMNDVEPELVGFVRNETAGASPDSFIGPDGALEIKTALGHIQADLLLKDEFPSEHRAQTQGVLWVCDREWIDLMVYSPMMPPLIKRAYRQADYISTLASEVDRFNSELEQVVEKLRAYGSGTCGEVS